MELFIGFIVYLAIGVLFFEEVLPRLFPKWWGNDWSINQNKDVK